ncbi:MAG: 4Fe-4S binding protein [Deltaproteobacteria bacterium]|jgi:polyferredoxin|nr:4Fe-4S binding protein [Deltaproteobacteria bacterium]
MSVTSLRVVIQHLAFIILTYGGLLRIQIGMFIPCLSCPFVYSCSGYCYLLIFQRSVGVILLPLTAVYQGSDPYGAIWSNFLLFLGGLGVFSILVILLGKTWCGWLCPFGLFQEWITRLRKAFRIRESEIILRHKHILSKIKYVLLVYMIVFPLLVSVGILPVDFILAFCNICPAKALMPLFIGDFQYMALDMSTGVAFGFSIALLAITAGMLIGAFFKDKFFCLFCPMLAIVNLYRGLYLLKVVKDPKACHGCGNCRRTCSMDNETIYRERVKSNVYDSDCMACFKCAEGCAADKSLFVKLGPFKIFSSSRSYASKR